MKTKVTKLIKHYENIHIFSSVYNQLGAVFLDSSLGNNLGEYSIIGLSPYMELKEVDGELYVNGKKSQDTFESYLKSYLASQKEENHYKLPLISGAIGYLSYDYGRKFEDIKTRHKDDINIPTAIFTFYDILIIEDKKNKASYITTRGQNRNHEDSINYVYDLLDSIPEYTIPEKQDTLATFDADFVKEDYKKAVDKVIDYIVDGDIYITNMTQRLYAKSDKHPFDVFKYLRAHNPSPFGGYFNYDGFKIVSASPERFLSMRNGKVETRPIKGTRRRGITPDEDDCLRLELQESQKDRSELLMIVDLERNDLNHVCIPGSVKVTELFEVEAYSTVFHLVSTIEGQLQDDLDVVDLIKATFPGGSITGAPKIRSMEIIDELENSRRGIYTGSFGYISLSGDCDLNIIIRTALYKDGIYTLGVGGGITCESDLEFEYEETLQKAKAVLEAIYHEKNQS